MPNVQTGQSEGDAGAAGKVAALRPPKTGFEAWLERCRTEVEEGLEAHLHEVQSEIGSQSRLAEAVQYSLKVGGKRLRPILVQESCRVCGGRAAKAMPAALAMEFIHTFSLIHDDLPAMDDDDLRRGQPTNHRVFGEALAVLAGDWLVTHAFSMLSADRCAQQVIPKLLHALTSGTKHMIEGQAADIEGEQRPVDGELVNYIHRNKTAALLETCCRLGAACGGASDDVTAALARYGRHLGLAFQITDDLLDATGSTKKMGKRVGKDADANKQTYPAAFGLEESRAQARRQIEAALGALETFGSRADRLRDLARYVVQREC